MRMIGIVIPTYKEKDNLEVLLPKLYETLKRENVFCFVADDYTDDGTRKLLSKLNNELDFRFYYVKCTERSFARAVAKGLDSAFSFGCQYFIQMDADMSHRPEDVTSILDSLKEGNDFILGIRLEKDKAFEFKFLRYRSSIANMIAKTVLGVPFDDITTGFHGFSRKAVEAIKPTEWVSRGFEVEVEMVYRAFKNGLKISTVPITFMSRNKGSSKRNLKEPFRFIYSILKIRLLI